MTLLPEVRRMTPFGREPVSRVPEECCLYLTSRNSIVQVSPFLDIWAALEGVCEVEFVLDMTEQNKCPHVSLPRGEA